MNKVKSILVTLAVLLSAVACENKMPVEPPVEYLEVNVSNISGTWELVEWNGAELQSGTYVFLNIIRKDWTYQMWQNVDSFQDVPHMVTGRFYLDVDPAVGAVIRGDYDHDSGDWAHRYIIKDLTKDSMIWVAKDNADYVQKFVRVESIPVAD